MSDTLFINLFTGMKLPDLLRKKAQYEFLLLQQTDSYIPPVSKKTGRPLKPAKMPWMVPTWKRGLEMVIAAIKEMEVAA